MQPFFLIHPVTLSLRWANGDPCPASKVALPFSLTFSVANQALARSVQALAHCSWLLPTPRDPRCMHTLPARG